MRILFVGGFARGHALLSRLLDRGEEIAGAYICPEDEHETPKFAPQLTALCQSRGIEARLARRLAAAEAQHIRQRLRPEVIFCLGWRTRFPSTVLEAAPRGVVAAHDSLLPRLRGYAPTAWGLVLGHQQLGVTLFRATEQVDAGPILFQEAFAAQPGMSLPAAQARIAELSVALFERYLDAARGAALCESPQAEALATWGCPRLPADGLIDWHASSDAIARLVATLAPPAPPAFTYLDGRRLDVLRAEALADPPTYEGRIPGRVIARDPAAGSVDVLAGSGIVRLWEVAARAGQSLAAAEEIKSVRGTLAAAPLALAGEIQRELAELRARVARLESLLPDESALKAAARHRT